MYPGHYVEFYKDELLSFKQLTPERDFAFFTPQKLQPQVAEGRLCAGVHVRPTLQPQWIMVPCDQAIPGASFVCESKTISDKPALKRGIFRAILECPRNSINIQSSCLHIVNSLSGNDDNLERVCGGMNLSVFRLPYFFIYSWQLSWIRWSTDESFFVKLLISMTHRWYTTFGQNADYTDIIVGAGSQRYGKQGVVGIRYSETNLAHIQVINIANYLPSSGLTVLLCNHSVLVTNSLCFHGHSMCEDGTCILSHYVCDGRRDCPDNSDEIDCSHVCSFPDGFIGDHNCFTSCINPECVCNELYFPCELGGCIPWSRVCDALPDCPSGEDEKICFFGNKTEKYAFFVEGGFTNIPSHEREESYYKCTNGPNIPHVLVDDLVPDCPEQDDEHRYYAFLKNGSRSDFFTGRVLCEEPDATTCEKNYRGVCYARHLHCVHEVISPKVQTAAVNTETCRNGAHLTNCMRYTCPSLFKCPSAYCVPVYAVCNGQVDCPNGEDEERCQSISCPGFLLCRYDTVCVHPQDVWSGRIKCPVSMDDKALRDRGACPGLCECLGNGIVCTKANTVDLRKFPQSMRILVINNTPFTQHQIQWNADLLALLHLEFSFCNISSVTSKHFRPLQFLQRLVLRNNFILFLPSKVFQHLATVTDIDLGHNLISQLHPDIFKGVSKLRVLKLDFNRLTVIEPCTFDELESLITLNLSNNYLTDLGDNVFCNLPSLIRELYFGGNHLVNIDKKILKSHMQHLIHLDTTPLQICCFVPEVRHCFPKERFFFSTCRNLFDLSFRYGALALGTCVLCVSICSVIWIFQRLREGSDHKAKNRNPSDILSLILFVSHCLVGIHVITLVGVSLVFQDYYALYEEKWKRHPLCILLNMLSYTLALVTMFLHLLISCIRMIACAFPFHISDVSLTKIMWVTVIFSSIVFGVSYWPYSDMIRLHINENHLALGFGLVMPVAIHGPTLWSLLGYVLPLTTMLFVSSAFQITCIHALLKKPQQLNASLSSLSHRRVSAGRCILNLVLPLCCHTPLLIGHAAASSDMEIPPYVSVVLTIYTLHVCSITNAILYVAITPAFIDFSVRCLR